MDNVYTLPGLKPAPAAPENPRPAFLLHRGRLIAIEDTETLLDHLGMLADERQARAQNVERAFARQAFDNAPAAARLHFTIAQAIGDAVAPLANRVRAALRRWPRHDPRIDLRAVQGFGAETPPPRRGISKQADLHIAGAMALALILAGGFLLVAPDRLIAAVLP